MSDGVSSSSPPFSLCPVPLADGGQAVDSVLQDKNEEDGEAEEMARKSPAKKIWPSIIKAVGSPLAIIVYTYKIPKPEEYSIMPVP